VHSSTRILFVTSGERQRGSIQSGGAVWKKLVSGHRFDFWKGLVAGHRFSDAAKGNNSNGFSRWGLPVAAQHRRQSMRRHLMSGTLRIFGSGSI
jgi:hypothetical protein